MCIYCGTNNYRRIYENHHGPIPIGQDGKSFHIHHKDGNHSNNSPNNLEALSVYDHYTAHFRRGDFDACLLLSEDLNVTQEEKSIIARKSNLKRVAEGTHPFLSINSDKVDKRVHKFINMVTGETIEATQKEFAIKLRVHTGHIGTLLTSPPTRKSIKKWRYVPDGNIQMIEEYVIGRRNPFNKDTDVHSFIHSDGESFIGTRHQMVENFGLTYSKVVDLIKGRSAKYRGWSLVK
jgi:hypothetical protein